MKARSAILLVFVSFPMLAQPKLVLLKKNTIIARFEEGEKIRFQRKDLTYRSGIITGIHSDFVKLGEEDTTYVYDIKRVDLRHVSNTQFKTASSGKKLIAAGFLLLLMDIFNNNTSHSLHPGPVTVSAALIGSGVLLQFVNNNYFRTSRKRKVGVIGG